MEEKKPTYEELVNAYNQLSMQANALRFDKINERLIAISKIIENKEKYSDKIIELAEWHLEQILAKPNEVTQA